MTQKNYQLFSMWTHRLIYIYINSWKLKMKSCLLQRTDAFMTHNHIKAKALTTNDMHTNCTRARISMHMFSSKSPSSMERETDLCRFQTLVEMLDRSDSTSRLNHFSLCQVSPLPRSPWLRLLSRTNKNLRESVCAENTC